MKNLKKLIAESVNFEGYDIYVDYLSIEKSIKNIFFSEMKVEYGKEKEKFVEWFCGLPSCLQFPCSEYDCENILKELGFDDAQIDNLIGSYNLEKLGLLIAFELFND